MKKNERNLDRDRLDFGDGKIGSLFRALFFPTLIAMIFTSALTVIDGIFVGHGVGACGIASVNIVAPVYMLGTGIGLMFGVGASVIAGIRMSEGNIKTARIVMTQAIAVGSLLMAVICGVCLLFPRHIVGLLGASIILETDAIHYLLWMLPGILFLCVQYVGMMLIRLDGSPRYAMWIQVVVAALNIVLDWYFIFPLHMGVMGAAIATSIANVAGGLTALAYFPLFGDRLRFYRLKLSVTSLLLTLRNTGYMAKIGFATMLTELAMGVMMFTGNRMFLSILDEDGVAAFAVVCYLFPVVFSIGNAVAQSAQPIISYNHGAGRHDRVRRALCLSLQAALVSGLFVTFFLAAGAETIATLFLPVGSKAWSLTVSGLPRFAVCGVFFAVNIAFIGYWQSIEHATRSTLLTLLRGVILLVPCFMLLPHMAGVAGLWFAIPLAEALTCGVITVMWLGDRGDNTNKANWSNKANKTNKTNRINKD